MDRQIDLGADEYDLGPGNWMCHQCGASNSDLDAECQFCEEEPVAEETDDAAWESEARLRDMEGYGTYEGPVTWP